MTHQEAVDTLATERYLLDEMPESERSAFEDHYFSCVICADDLRDGSAMAQGAREGFAPAAAAGNVVRMRTGGTPAPRRPAWYQSVALPWAAAATLAVVAGYQSLSGPGLGRDGQPIALAPVTLRSVTRGAEPVVTIPPHGPITLAIEVGDAPPHGELTYDVRRTDGTPIVSGRAPVPPPGTPLLLLMPSWTLVAPMHYILTVRDAGSAGPPLGDYRFAVAAP
jgi:hypothetical protein